MGVVWQGGAYIACSAERNRLKLHIIHSNTPNLPRAQQQQLLPTAIRVYL